MTSILLERFPDHSAVLVEPTQNLQETLTHMERASLVLYLKYAVVSSMLLSQGGDALKPTLTFC